MNQRGIGLPGILIVVAFFLVGGTIAGLNFIGVQDETPVETNVVPLPEQTEVIDENIVIEQNIPDENVTVKGSILDNLLLDSNVSVGDGNVTIDPNCKNIFTKVPIDLIKSFGGGVCWFENSSNSIIDGLGVEPAHFWFFLAMLLIVLGAVIVLLNWSTSKVLYYFMIVAVIVIVFLVLNAL